MLWLSNIAAFSVQFGVLVATGLVLVRLLRIDAPAAVLRFWQAVLATSLLWPAYQLFTSDATAASGRPLFSAGASWLAATAPTFINVPTVPFDSLVPWLLVALAGGAALRLAWIGIGLMRLRTIRRQSASSSALAALAASLHESLHVDADVRLCDAVDSPVTIGARRPVVLVPPRLCDLPQEVQRAVLCHELLHVRRRDWLPTLGEELWCALLWFHPAARALASRLSLARESLVDAATVAHTHNRRAYAAALVEFATRQRPLVGAAPFIRRRHLEHRLTLLAQEVPMSRRSLIARLTLTAATVAAATFAATSHAPLSAIAAAQAEKVYDARQDNAVTLPQVVTEVKPVYTAKAMQAKLQGTVWTEVVVRPDGTVGEVRIVKSLDSKYGLDDEAVAAARKWTFKPGTKDGKAVPVVVTIEMTFTLKK